MVAEAGDGDVRVSVLGSTEVDGQRLTERQRPLVAALALGRGAPAPIELLLEAMWPTDAPDTARQCLQNQVTRLRQRFGPDLIETVAGGYRLTARTDADQLEHRLAACVDGPVHPGDAAVIGDALRAWRGLPYVDLLDLPEAEPERARLERLRARAAERSAVAHVAAGELGRAILELEALTLEDPLCERRWELLMAALHLDGRRGDALAVFDRAADHLDAELGVGPSAPLVALRDRIAAADGAVLADVGDVVGLGMPPRCGNRPAHRSRCTQGVRR